MKIIFFGSANNLNISKIGGIESTIRELSNYLVKSGHEVDLYVMTAEIKLQKKVMLKDGFVNLFYLSNKDARKAILKSEYDIINFIQTPFENILFTFRFLIKKLFGNFITSKFFFTYPIRGNKLLNTVKSALFFNYHFTFSERLQSEVIKTSREVIKLLPPVSEDFYNAHKKKMKRDKSRILFIGRLSKEKGLDLVLDVFGSINKEKYSTSILGYFKTDEAKQSYLNKINSAHIDEVKIANDTNSDKKKFTPPLWDYDILFLPYLSLTSTLDTPLLILEGLVSKCKVITTSEGFNKVDNPNLYRMDKDKSMEEVLSLIDFVSAQNWVEFDEKIFSVESIAELYIKSITENIKNA